MGPALRLRCRRDGGPRLPSLSLVHFEHVFSAVRGIAGKLPAPRIDHQVEIFQRNLAHQHRDVVRHLQDVDRAIAALDRQPYRLVFIGLTNALARGDALRSPLIQSQLADQSRGQRKDRGPRVDQGIVDHDPPHLVVGQGTAFHGVKVLEILDNHFGQHTTHRCILHGKHLVPLSSEIARIFGILR